MAKTQGKVGLNRIEAAAWVSHRAGYTVPHTSLRNWERRGLLRDQQPGRRVPCSYGVPELLAAATIATLRRDGASLQRVRRALRELRRLLPNLEIRPGSWRLCVTPAGDVQRVSEDGHELLELTRQPGQLGSFHLLDGAGLLREAHAALGENQARMMRADQIRAAS